MASSDPFASIEAILDEMAECINPLLEAMGDAPIDTKGTT